MASVWYIGPADSRTITAAQWAAAGIAGASDTVWNKANGWSLPQASLTAPQRAILDANGGFNTNAPDGPRPGSGSVSPGTTGSPVYTGDLGGLGLDNANMQRQAGLINSSRDQSRYDPFTVANGAYTSLPPRVAVPPGRAAVIEYGAGIICTVAGAGIVGVGVNEYSSGALVDRSFTWQYGSWVTGVFNSMCGFFHGSLELDPSTSWRYYRLMAGSFRDSGSLATKILKSDGGGGTVDDDRSMYLRVRNA